MKIDHLVHRSYGMFSGLFGIRNHGEFRPIAPNRGEPPGPSNEFSMDHDGSGAVGTTWITWSEMSAMEWEEEEEAAQAEQALGRPPRRRKDYLVGGWLTLYKLMEVLAEQSGPENVRLSVWFDQP